MGFMASWAANIRSFSLLQISGHYLIPFASLSWRPVPRLLSTLSGSRFPASLEIRGSRHPLPCRGWHVPPPWHRSPPLLLLTQMVKVCFLGSDLPHQNSLRLASTPISLVKVPTFFSDLHQITLRLSPTYPPTFPKLPSDLPQPESFISPFYSHLLRAT